MSNDKYNLESINDRTDEIDRIIEANRSVGASIMESTVFTQMNIEKLKYLATPYAMHERHDIVLDYIKSKFDNIDEKSVSDILSKHGIKQYNYYLWKFEILTSLFALCVTTSVYGAFGLFSVSLVSILSYVASSIILYMIFGAISNSYYMSIVRSTKVNYKLSKEFKQLGPAPVKSLDISQKRRR